MNLTALLQFLPLLIGFFLAYHLIFKQNLPGKSIGSILTYFLGILIVFIAISWLITTFLAGWAADMLQAGTADDWGIVINQSEGIVEDAFATGDGSTSPETVQVQQPAQQIIIVTPVPNSGTSSGGDRAITTTTTQGTTYTVVAGDTLTTIAQKFNTTVKKIAQVNGLANPNAIQPGQVLVIPSE